MHIFAQVITCSFSFTNTRPDTSMPLTEALLHHGTMFTGTVIKNRKDLPAVVRDRRFSLQAGETRCFRDGRLLTLAWRAESKKKPLIMLSSSSSRVLRSLRQFKNQYVYALLSHFALCVMAYCMHAYMYIIMYFLFSIFQITHVQVYIVQVYMHCTCQ